MKRMALTLAIALLAITHVPAMASGISVTMTPTPAPAPAAAPVQYSAPSFDYSGAGVSWSGYSGGGGYVSTGYAPVQHTYLYGPDAFSHNVDPDLPVGAFVQNYTW